MGCKYNPNNKGHLDGYKLFLGEPLGLTDTINVTHPQFEKLFTQQMGQIWNEFEVDLTQDALDMLKADEGTVDLMRKVISWQALADSVISRSVVDVLGKYCTDSSLSDFLAAWNLFESIHGKTYSHIIKQTFVDPKKGLEEIYENEEIFNRSKKLISVLEELSNFDDSHYDYPDEGDRYKKGLIYRAIVAFFILEGVSFMGSFSVTFAIAETGIFQGIAQDVKLVCRDELLHCRASYEMIKVLQDDPEWAEAIESCKGEVEQMLNESIEDEQTFSEYLFSEGRSVVGLNQTLYMEYVRFSATTVYKALKIDFKDAIEVDPLPYMKDYIDSSMIQVAAQEIQLTSYNVGVIIDDSTGLDLSEYNDLVKIPTMFYTRTGG